MILSKKLLLVGWSLALIVTISDGLEPDAERIAIGLDGQVISRPDNINRGVHPGGIRDGSFLIPSQQEISTSSVPTPTRTNGAQTEDFDYFPGSGETSAEENDYSSENDGESGEGEASGDEPSIEEDEIQLSELRDGENVTHSDNVIPHDGQESKNSLVIAKPRDLKASATGYGGGYGDSGGGQYVKEHYTFFWETYNACI